MFGYLFAVSPISTSVLNTLDTWSDYLFIYLFICLFKIESIRGHRSAVCFIQEVKLSMPSVSL